MNPSHHSNQQWLLHTYIHTYVLYICTSTLYILSKHWNMQCIIAYSHSCDEKWHLKTNNSCKEEQVQYFIMHPFVSKVICLYRYVFIYRGVGTGEAMKPGLHRKSELLLHRNFKHLRYMYEGGKFSGFTGKKLVPTHLYLLIGPLY